jgi:ABC-2 type transport system permease protein
MTRSYKLALIHDAVFGIVELAVYFFISRTFGNVAPAGLQGAPSYFAFAAVGAALGAPIYAATAGIGERLRQEQLTGTLEVLMTNPLSVTELCLGLSGFSFLFALARAFLYLVVAGVWMHLDLERASWIGAVVVLLCVGLALAALGVLAGAAVLVFKRGHVVAGTAVAFMTYLSGAVFPVSALPGWLEPVGKLMPIRFALDGIRAALFQGGGWGFDVAVLVAYGAVGLPLSIVAFSFAMTLAKRAGSLGQY